jgi:hypothetical protein
MQPAGLAASYRKRGTGDLRRTISTERLQRSSLQMPHTLDIFDHLSVTGWIVRRHSVNFLPTQLWLENQRKHSKVSLGKELPSRDGLK